MSAPLLGIDLGGTKTEAVVLGANGDEVARERVPTVPGSYDATLSTIAGLVARMEAATGHEFTRIGIGIPGSVAPHSGLVRNANSTWINGRPLAVDLENRLSRRVRIANDANCLALSETRDGAAAGADPVFAVILGTGIGGALVTGGRVVSGAQGLGGEWGHIPISGEEAPPRPCFCGRLGCIEQYLSGPALSRDYARDDPPPAEDIAARAAAGEGRAQAVLARHRERLARMLGVVVNILDPQVIVLGGGLSNLPGLAESLPALLAAHIFASDGAPEPPQVRRARWGDSSGVRGAARLWEAEE